MTQPPSNSASTNQSEPRGIYAWLHDTHGRTFSRMQKLVLLLTFALCLTITLLVARSMHVPRNKGFSPSLVQNSGMVTGLTAAAVALVASGVVATLLVGRIRPDAPIFCAALALGVLRLHAGPMHVSLITGGGVPALINSVIELGVLSLLLLGFWAVLRLLVSRGILPDDVERDGAVLPMEKLDQRLLCTIAAAAITGVIMMILCQSDEPTQAIWSLFIASWAGAWCAFRFIPTAPGVCYWAGPLLLGIAGYAYTWMYGGATAAIGRPGGFLAVLTFAAPLDYATFGVAGATIAYWTSRRHHRERAESEDRSPAPPPAVTYSTG